MHEQKLTDDSDNLDAVFSLFEHQQSRTKGHYEFTTDGGSRWSHEPEGFYYVWGAGRLCEFVGGQGVAGAQNPHQSQIGESGVFPWL